MILVRRSLITLFCVALLLSAFPVGLENSGYMALGDEVTFPDPDLEEVIRDKIGKPTGPITEADLAGITSLSAGKSNITDLIGLEYCTNLIHLSLWGNQISDLSPLAGMTNLTHLDLWANQISDLSPLAGLTNLTYLDLGANQISDLSPLAGLTNLTDLDLFINNQISDLSPLAGLTNLQWLLLDSNQISDLSPLAGLTNLTELGLGANQISDLSPLAGLTNLQSLGLPDNQISDLSPLAGLTNLTNLDLRANQISDLSPLAGMTNLTNLDLRANQISDLSPLAGMTNLTDLFLGVNQISDLSPLAGMTNLTDLLLGANQISDLSSLAGLTNLTNLFLDYNQISNLSAISGMTKLGTGTCWITVGDNQCICLGLSDNQITDINPLVASPGIDDGDGIDLRGNPLSAQTAYTYIPQLEARGVVVLHDELPWSPLIYDENLNGEIEYGEMVDALMEYLTGTISYSQMIDVLMGYLTGIPDNSLEISSTSGGEVTIPGEGTFGPYYGGAVVNLEANPHPGYNFTGWMGDINTITDVNDPSTTITMNGDYSICAGFSWGGGSDIVGTSWVYEVNYDCDEMGVGGTWITLANDTTWTVTVTGFEDVEGVQCYVTDTEVEGNAERRYPYPGGVTPAVDVPVLLAPEGIGPTDYRSMEHREMVKELFPLRANAMGGINLEVAREYTYHDRPAELSVGDTWTYESQVELEAFLFSEHMTWNAEVTGIESVTVPLGTFDCYKVEATGTGGGNPDATNYYWWAVDEDFLCPVKYQYNYIFLGSETKELSSYTPAS